MERIECGKCGATVGQRAGNVVLLKRGDDDQITIVAAESVTRTCRRCGADNELVPQRAALAAVR